MPIYSYKCEECGGRLDITFLRSANKGQDPRIWHFCPYCVKNTHMKAAFGAPAFKFKGSGFYENDYKD